MLTAKILQECCNELLIILKKIADYLNCKAVFACGDTKLKTEYGFETETQIVAE